jgi:hypothetical protein
MQHDFGVGLGLEDRAFFSSASRSSRKFSMMPL